METATPIFLSSLWQEALATGLRFPVKLMCIADPCTDIPVGIALLHVRSCLGAKWGRRPFATLYNIFWQPSAIPATRHRALRELLRQHGLLAAEFREMLEPAVPHGPGVTTTLRNRLPGIPLQSRYRQLARRCIKKAEKAGVELMLSWDPPRCFRLLDRHHRQVRQVPLRFSQPDFTRFCEILSTERLSFFFAVTAAGRDSAVHAVLQDQRIAYDILSAREPDLRKSPDNYLLVHQIMLHYQREGFEWFDHCGGNIRSTAEFKSRFSPESVFLRTQWTTRLR